MQERPLSMVFLSCLSAALLLDCKIHPPQQRLVDSKNGTRPTTDMTLRSVLATYGEPDRVETGTHLEPCRYNPGDGAFVRPGEAPVETWYYGDQGRWFHFGHGRFIAQQGAYEHRDLRLLGWGEEPSKAPHPSITFDKAQMEQLAKDRSFALGFRRIALSPAGPTGASSAATAIAFHPSTGEVANGRRGLVDIWHAETAELRRTLATGATWVTSIAYTQDGERLVVGNFDGSLQIWDSGSGERRSTLQGHARGLLCLSVSTDASLVVSGSADGTLWLWDVSTGKKREKLGGHKGPVRAVEISPNGRLLASGSEDKTVRLWEIETGLVVGTLTGHVAGVRSVAFHPEGGQLASGSWDRTIILWDVDAARATAKLEGHRGPVLSVAFDPKGAVVASGSTDRTVRIWDVKGARTLSVLNSMRSAILDVAFRPDGETIAAARFDGNVLEWRTPRTPRGGQK